MIYLLLLFLLFVARIAFFNKRNTILKNKKYFIINLSCEGVFFSKKNLLYYKESKEYLQKHGFQRAKILDDILLMSRMNYVDVSNIEFDKLTFYIGRQELKYLDEIFYAKAIEDFVLFTNLKIENENIIFCNKNEFNNFKSLNLNRKIDRLEILECESDLYFNQKFQKTREYSSSYILEKFENNDFLIFKYIFILNYKIVYIKIINKNEVENNLKIHYFYDLENEKYNYYQFKLENNYISYKNLISNKVYYLNYNLKFNAYNFSKIKHLKMSNKPCISISYDMKFESKETKHIILCHADGVCELSNIKLEDLFFNSLKAKQEFFKYDFKFVDSQIQKIYLEVFSQAQNEYLEGMKAKNLKINFKELLSLYNNKKISALDFYHNLVYNTIKYSTTGIELATDFIDCDFIILFFQSQRQKQVRVKKFCTSTAIIINGIRFSSSKNISFASLDLHDDFLLETS